MNNQVLFRILEGQNIEGKYYLKKLLGSGGFGGVYLADEVVRDKFIRELAVKLIITDNPDKQLDELIFSTTLKHPNLIDCYTCGECQLNNIEFLYLLMEKADYSLEGHSSWVNSVAISRDGKTIVSCSYDDTIKIWDLETGNLLHTLEDHSDAVCSVAISRDGKTIVSSSSDKTIKIWDLHSGNLLRTIHMEGFLKNGANWVWIANQVLFSPDDTQIIASCSDRTIKIWDVEEILNL